MTASSGKEALEKIGSERFDLYIFDLAMPLMNGYELLKVVRSGPKMKAKVPAIALSAFSAVYVKDEVEAAGFQKFIQKDQAVDTLISAINDLVPSKGASQQLY